MRMRHSVICGLLGCTKFVQISINGTTFEKEKTMTTFYNANVDTTITLVKLDIHLLFFDRGRPFCTLAGHRVFSCLSDHNTFIRHSCLPCCSVTNRPKPNREMLWSVTDSDMTSQDDELCPQKPLHKKVILSYSQ
jgi:hypothetical protein